MLDLILMPRLEILQNLRGIDNRNCADCNFNLSECNPLYSLKHNVWICPLCRSAHHLLEIGNNNSNNTSHYSRSDVLWKSRDEDAWTDDDVKQMQIAGNNRIRNEFYEKYKVSGWDKPTHHTAAHERHLWILAKYDCGLFTFPHSVNKSSRILPDRVADYFLVLSPGTLKKSSKTIQHPEDVFFEPKVSSCYPNSSAYDDMEIPSHICNFAYPLGMTLSGMERHPYFFSFVFTDINGTRIYGSILHFFELLDTNSVRALTNKHKSLPKWEVLYAPRAIAVISHYPFYNLFREYLAQCYHVSMSSSPLPLERFVANLITETPLPPMGVTEVQWICTGYHNRRLSIARPPPNQLPMVDFSYRPLFGCLCVENIMVIFQSLLVERQLCVFSENPCIINPVLEALLSLLFPLVWQGAYIPILPKDMLEILDAPIPFITGIHRSLVDDIPEMQRPAGVLFVDLDMDEVTVRVEDTRPTTNNRTSNKAASSSGASVNGNTSNSKGISGELKNTINKVTSGRLLRTPETSYPSSSSYIITSENRPVDSDDDDMSEVQSNSENGFISDLTNPTLMAPATPGSSDQNYKFEASPMLPDMTNGNPNSSPFPAPSIDGDSTTPESFKLPPMPDKETGKLWQKLLDYGSCIHRTSNMLSAISAAGDIFPNNEHMVPIESFPIDGMSSELEPTTSTSSIRSGNTKSEGSGRRRSLFAIGGDADTNGSRGAKVRANPAKDKEKEEVVNITVVSTRSPQPAASVPSILDPNNNCEAGDNFDAREVRAGFLRFFVSVLKDHSTYTSSSVGSSRNGTIAVFDIEGFLTQHAPESHEFLRSMLSTQMFDKWLQDSVNYPDAYDVRFFQESIKAKLNRSRFNKRSATPFLSDDRWQLKEIFTPPLPSIQGLEESKRFVYKKFPDINLDATTLGPIRVAKALNVDQTLQFSRETRYDTGATLANLNFNGSSGGNMGHEDLSINNNTVMSPISREQFTNFGLIKSPITPSTPGSSSTDAEMARVVGVGNAITSSSVLDFSLGIATRPDSPTPIFTPSPTGDVVASRTSELAPLLYRAKGIYRRLVVAATIIASLYRMRHRRIRYLRLLGHSETSIARRMQPPEKSAAVYIQKKIRGNLARKQYKKMKAALLIVQQFIHKKFGCNREKTAMRSLVTLARYWRMYKARQKVGFFYQQLERKLRSVLLLLWEADCTSLLVRSDIWRTFIENRHELQTSNQHQHKPNALLILALEEEMMRLCYRLNIESLVVSNASTLSTSPTTTTTTTATTTTTTSSKVRPSLRIRSDAESGIKTFMGALQRRVDTGDGNSLRRKEILKIERSKLYEILKTRCHNDVDMKENLFRRFSIEGKKRKQTLTKRLWTETNTIDESALVIRHVVDVVRSEEEHQWGTATMTNGARVSVIHFAEEQLRTAISRITSHVAVQLVGALKTGRVFISAKGRYHSRR